MAALSIQASVNSGVSAAPVTLTTSTLTTSDTFTYTQGAGQWLLLSNKTAGTITCTLAGTAPNTAIPVAGYGGTVSAAGGKAIVLATNQIVLVYLDSISQYLAGNGTVTITSTAANVIACLYS